MLDALNDNEVADDNIILTLTDDSDEDIETITLQSREDEEEQGMN